MPGFSHLHVQYPHGESCVVQLQTTKGPAKGHLLAETSFPSDVSDDVLLKWAAQASQTCKREFSGVVYRARPRWHPPKDTVQTTFRLPESHLAALEKAYPSSADGFRAYAAYVAANGKKKLPF
jgi:hypothetical protein